MTTHDSWGVADGWWGTDGAWHTVDPETRQALRTAQGAADHPDGPPSGDPIWFVRHGSTEPLWSPATIELEGGDGTLEVDRLPPELPLGAHRLVPADGGPVTRLFVVPARIDGPGRTWAWSTQLYATRSQQSWGIGDLGDLATLATWSAHSGAALLAHNPLGDALPLPYQQPSPYYASSRRFLSPLYLRVEDVTGAAVLGDELTLAAAAGRDLRAAALIDRDAVWQLKLSVLGRIWDVVRHDPGVRQRLADWTSDAAARDHARFCALAEHHGTGWSAWADEHRHPSAAGVREFADGHRDRVEFWAWLQLEADAQLAGASTAGAGLLADLPVGFDPSGADAWMDQDLLALGCSVGAPPDELGPTGQDWGLPPYVPWRLRAAGYAPWIDTLRRMFRRCDALRIDHVMGLFRLFWIPPGGDASHGGFVDQRDAAHRPGGDGHTDSGFVPVELLDLVLMEAARAGATVVGEDLGTVEPEVRAAMSDRNVFGYRIGWFEDEPAHDWPAETLAALTTHDLPTAAGLWTGEDEADRVRAGLAPDPGEVAIMRGRLLRLAADGDALADVPMVDPSDERSVVVGAHRGLATSGSDLAVATLEDAVGAVRRPNLPGTVDQHPNWRIPLPVDIEALDEAGAAQIARVMRAAGR